MKKLICFCHSFGLLWIKCFSPLPPQIYRLKSQLLMRWYLKMGSLRGSYGAWGDEGGAPMMGLYLCKRHQKSCCTPLHPMLTQGSGRMGTKWNDSCPHATRGGLRMKPTCQHLDLGFLASTTARNKFLLFTSLWYFAMVAPAKTWVEEK